MSRSLDDDSLRSPQDRGTSTDPSPLQISQESRDQGAKSIYQNRGQRYRLDSDQSRMLRDLGAFRTITTNSLRKHLYDNDDERFRKDLRSLVRPSLRGIGGPRPKTGRSALLHATRRH